METTIINARHVSSLASKIEVLKSQVQALRARTEEKKLKTWMDTQDVLFTLNISS